MNYNVRLRERDIMQIIESFKEHFGPHDHLWLFGSRIDMSKRGGDIDLYVETYLTSEESVKKKLRFVGNLWTRIGEQKIDVVVHLMHSDFHLPIYDVARTEGVQLV